jgi:ferritin
MDNNKRPESMQRITTPELARAFIDEQVEEEENARDLVHQAKMIGDHIGGMIMLDKELGAREYHTPSPLK